MNLRQLEVFIAVVECGKITKAAEKLFVAQPSVSQTIAEIESQYGVKLFDRLNKKLYITSLGETLYKYAKTTVKSFEEIESILRDLSCARNIKVGASVTIGNCILPKLIQNFSKEHVVNFEKIIVDNTENIIEKILDGRLDLAIVEGNVDNDNLKVKKLCDDEIIFVASQDFTLKTNEIENFIVREVGSGTREMTEEKLKSLKLKIKNLWEMSSTEAIKNMLSVGGCVSAISKRIVESELARGALKIILPEKITRKFYLIHHKDKILSELLNEFAKNCEAVL